jgi:hypothetical protein
MTSNSASHSGWRPGARLTRIEDEMLGATAAGEHVDRGEGSFDLATLKTWGPRRTIRARVLRHLLIEEEWPVHSKGVRLSGIRISGHLDLEAATLRCPLRLEHCYFSNPRPVNFGYASASLLTLTGCHLAGLKGDTLTVTKELDLTGSTFTSQLRLPGADITGQLICSGARLTGADGDALVADGMKAGRVLLDQGFTAAGAVRLPGADIGGQLSCSGARLTGADSGGSALVADGMKAGSVFLDQGFTAAGAVRLPGADITGQLICRGARLTDADSGGNALVADRLKAGRVLLDQGFNAAGAVRLLDADIGGQLSCSGARLTGADSDGSALVADGVRVAGDMGLDQGFAAAGAVRLPGADIGGQLNCSGARLTGAGNALVADRMKADSVFLDQGFNAVGAVRLPGADIGGQLNCSGARLTGTDSDGNALVADGVRVAGDMFLDQGFTAAGTLSLRSARIDGSLSLRPSGLADVEDKAAIDATGAQITHTLLWSPSQQITGLVILEDATIGQLTDHWTQDAGAVNGYWPSAATGQLLLDGFTYTRTGGQYQATLEQRLAWIGSHSERTAASTRTRFASQPYEQLAQVYRQAGQDKEARKVAIARRRDLRRYSELSQPRKLGNWLLEKTIQYGYQTWRAVAGIIVLYAAVLVFLWFARYHEAFIPVQTIVGLHPVPTATSCSSHYPCFNPFGYAIDTVIPLINVHQADFWGPNESVTWGTASVVVSYLGTGFGWILATLAVAGYTGLARTTDAP